MEYYSYLEYTEWVMFYMDLFPDLDHYFFLRRMYWRYCKSYVERDLLWRFMTMYGLSVKMYQENVRAALESPWHSVHSSLFLGEEPQSNFLGRFDGERWVPYSGLNHVHVDAHIIAVNENLLGGAGDSDPGTATGHQMAVPSHGQTSGLPMPDSGDSHMGSSGVSSGRESKSPERFDEGGAVVGQPVSQYPCTDDLWEKALRALVTLDEELQEESLKADHISVMDSEEERLEGDQFDDCSTTEDDSGFCGGMETDDSDDVISVMGTDDEIREGEEWDSFDARKITLDGNNSFTKGYEKILTSISWQDSALDLQENPKCADFDRRSEKAYFADVE